MATTPKAYGKRLVVNSSNGAGTHTFSGVRANAVLNRLNDNPRYWHTTADDGSEVYFDTEGECGFCEIATLTYDSKNATPLDCEDAIPNCPEATAEKPVEGYSAQ